MLQFYKQKLKIMTKPFTGFLWMVWLWSWGSMGRIEADIALELAVRISALFGTGTVYPKWTNLGQGRNSNRQASAAILISALILPIMAESRTGPKFGHLTFDCNICSSFTQRTSQSCLNLWMGWCWSWGFISGIWAEIAFESWLFESWPRSKLHHLPQLMTSFQI